MAEIIILQDNQLQGIGDAIYSRVKEMISEEKKAYEPYLTPKQLSEVFPYSREWFRDKINAGEFGEKARNGDTMAKYKEVEKYLFGK